jgi:NAD(P)-dependent dehydrogenase (short-subunit alcohol dehydrogenase family)
MTLDGRVGVITGGKRIGQAVARELAARGVDLALSWRSSEPEADETAEAVRAKGRRALTVRADVTRREDCELLMAAAARGLGRLDILVCMASTYREIDLDHLTEAEWRRDLDANLTSAFLCAHAAVPHMRSGGGGRIVNFADWIAKSGRPAYRGFTAYYVAKAGVIALTEVLALELASDGILVNAVAPGPIVPPPGISEAEAAAVARATPLGRWGGEAEIAHAVVALIESDFITGETVRVDGGRHLR